MPVHCVGRCLMMLAVFTLTALANTIDLTSAVAGSPLSAMKVGSPPQASQNSSDDPHSEEPIWSEAEEDQLKNSGAVRVEAAGTNLVQTALPSLKGIFHRGGKHGVRVIKPRIVKPHVRGPRVFGPSVRGPSISGPSIRGPSIRGGKLRGPRITGPRIRGPHFRKPRVIGPAVRGPRVQGPAVIGPGYAGGRIGHRLFKEEGGHTGHHKGIAAPGAAGAVSRWTVGSESARGPSASTGLMSRPLVKEDGHSPRTGIPAPGAVGAISQWTVGAASARKGD